MKSLRLRSRVAWAAPVVLALPLLLGADGNGCQPGGPIPVGSGDDAGGAADGGVRADAGSACTPASCAGMAVPALAKLCPDGTTLTESVCEEQSDGHCGWAFPACPTDACPPSDLPCTPCAYGSTGVGKDANGCDTCPICAPPPDAGPTTDACPATAPICNLPDCMYGVIPQKDANGCDICAICAPAPDAGTACSSDSDCSGGDVCGFLESGGCGITGTCFPAPTVVCNAYAPGCACDGSEVNTTCNGLPTGYARSPIKHMGVCVDGG
jgi:hypothetical protein